MLKVSIIGANGYTGLELMNLLSDHPHVELKHVVSRSNEGTFITDLYPALFKLRNVKFEGLSAIEEIKKDSDFVFACLPHAASANLCAELFNAGVKVIDLSADFRYKNIKTYEDWYNVSHPHPELICESVYGLCEINRDKIKSAKLIGNPGCYTTCSILALYPLLHEKIVETTNIIIDAKSGVSGAGRKADVAYNICETNESFKAYSVGTHRHTSEIEEQLTIASNEEIKLSFTPHLLPIQRGILATCYLNLKKETTKEDIANAFNKFYENEYFINVYHNGKLPSINEVKCSNYVSIGYKIDLRLNRLVVVSCIDNLIKGASGQAVQNMNIIAGIDETCGLTKMSHHI